jgi:hypothetical protein
MITVSAETVAPIPLRDAWIAIGRRACYVNFPGISPVVTGPRSRGRGALEQDLDLPLIGRRRQRATLTIDRSASGDARQFKLRGGLMSITGRWRLDPHEAGVRLHLTLEYDVCSDLREQAVDELRSRSPLPIRTDADAILGQAVDEFFQVHFAADAQAYCRRVRDHLDEGRPP